MITDFSEYAGQRSITFNGKNSLSDFGVLMHKATEYPTVKPRVIQENIPFRNGSIDFSTISGKYNFEDREISIVFLILAETNAEAMEKISALNNWLFAVTDKKLYDSDIEGYCFTNVTCTETYTEALIKGGVPVIGYRARFTAAPYMESTTGTRAEIVQLAGRTITAYILANSVLCLGYTYPESPQMTAEISGTTMTLTYDLPGADYAGLRCFDVSGTPDFTLTGGTLGGDPVTIAGAHNFYCDVPAWNYTLRLTATVAEGASSPYIVIAIGAGIAFAHDDSKRYAIDDYAVGTHTLKVSGQTAAFSGFTLPNGNYDTLEIVGEREGVYDLRYDSVERSL